MLSTPTFAATPSPDPTHPTPIPHPPSHRTSPLLAPTRLKLWTVHSVELVDEPAEAVAPLLQGYRDALSDPSPAQTKRVWQRLKTIPDANGNPQVSRRPRSVHRASPHARTRRRQSRK